MLPYQDPSLSPEERAKDLLSRMTLEEKFLQMNNYMHVEPTFEQLQKEGTLAPRGSIFTDYLYEEEHLNAPQEYYVNRTRLGIPLLVAFEGQRGLQNRHGTVAVIGNNGKDSFLGDYTVNTPPASVFTTAWSTASAKTACFMPAAATP